MYIDVQYVRIQIFKNIKPPFVTVKKLLNITLAVRQIRKLENYEYIFIQFPMGSTIKGRNRRYFLSLSNIFRTFSSYTVKIRTNFPKKYVAKRYERNIALIIKRHEWYLL